MDSLRNGIRTRRKAKRLDDGFPSEIAGRVHYVDPIAHELRIEVKPGEFERVAFDSVVGVKVVN